MAAKMMPAATAAAVVVEGEAEGVGVGEGEAAPEAVAAAAETAEAEAGDGLVPGGVYTTQCCFIWRLKRSYSMCLTAVSFSRIPFVRNVK